MKKAKIIIIALLSTSFLFTACQKENLFEDQDPIASIDDSTPHDHRKCGMDDVMEKLLQDPTYAQEHAAKMSAFDASQKVSGLTSAVTLPIAVHFRGVTNTNRACLTQIVNEQMTALNRDFATTNADKTKFTTKTSFFPGVNLGNSKVSFKMATKNHPSGYGLTNGQAAITINKTGNLNAFKGYINIIVKGNTGGLGSSPLGGTGLGDYIEVDATAFGVGKTCGNVKAQNPFNKGRTLVHEMGHYLLLDHIWGNGCGTDDKVGDTPSQQGPNYGNPSYGKKSCNTNDLWVNYMDYVDDASMVMFSAGQVQRMENYVQNNLQNVITKGNSVLASGSGGGGGSTTTNPSPTTKIPLQVRVRLDQYGSETSWQIRRKGNNKLMAKSPKYYDGQKHQVKRKNVSLAPGTYKFIVRDSYGDGLCCTYGKGWASIFKRTGNKKRIVHNNGKFGKSRVTTFTITNNSARIDHEETAPLEAVPLKAIY